MRNQKKILTPIPDDCGFVFSADEGVTGGEANAIINKVNIRVTKNNVSQDIPHHTGPKGVIQSWLDHPTKKITRKKVKKLRQGPRPLNNANIKVSINETIKALDITYNPFMIVRVCE